MEGDKMFGHDLNDIVFNLFFNIFCHLIAGGLLIVILYHVFVPKLSLSKNIAFKKESNGEKSYFFKFINRSSYPMRDIKYSLYKVTSLGSDIVVDFVSRGNIERISGKVFLRKNKYNRNCFIVSINEDIHSILCKPDSFIELIVELTTDISFISPPKRRFLAEYYNVSCLQMGYFGFGTNMKVIQG